MATREDLAVAICQALGAPPLDWMEYLEAADAVLNKMASEPVEIQDRRSYAADESRLDLETEANLEIERLTVAIAEANRSADEWRERAMRDHSLIHAAIAAGRGRRIRTILKVIPSWPITKSDVQPTGKAKKGD